MITPDEDGWMDVTQKYAYPGEVDKEHLGKFKYFVIKDISVKSNLECFGANEFKRRGAKYFLMIMEDMKEFEDVKKNGPRQYSTELLDNWTEHAKINPKRLAVRGFTYKEIGSRIVHVLTDDVLELIPILMERQKMKPESYKNQLTELREKWRVQDPNMTRSIRVDEFKNIMNKFKVDKTQIVIAPDIQSYVSTLRTLYHGAGPITTYNRDGNLIMTAHQALFHIFQSTVYGYNWHELKKNPRHQKKFDDYYKSFGEVTKKYWDMEQGLLVTLSLVEKDIENLRKHNILSKKWAKKVRLHTCENSKYSDEIPFEQLETYCMNLGIACLKNPSTGNNVPVHLARAGNLYAYTGMFFQDDVAEQKMMLVDGLLSVLDFHRRRSYRKLLRTSIYRKVGKEEPEYSSGSDTEESDADEDEPASTDVSHSKEQPATASPSLNDNSSTTSEAAESESTDDTNSGHCSKTDHSTMCVVVPDNFDLASAVSKNQTFKIVFTCCGSIKLSPFTPPPPKTKFVAHPVLSDRCNQCYENIGKLKTAQSELKNAENRAKLYEKQSKKTEELEKEIGVLKTKRENADKHRMKAKANLDEAVMKATNNEKRAREADELEEKLKVKNAKLEENKKEIEELKNTITSQPDLAQKILTLEERLANREVIEKKLRESNKELKSQNDDLNMKLESQTRSNKLYQEHFAQKYREMQDEMAGNRQLSDELVTQNLTLSEEITQLKANALLNQAALEEKSDINARLQNEKVQLHQKIKDLERQLQNDNGSSGSQ